MLKIQEFKGTITSPNVTDEMNKYIKELSQNQIIDIKYNTNLANITKADGTTDLLVVSSAMLLYEE